MKQLKFCFVFLFTAVLTTTSTAQGDSPNRIGGIRAGYNGAVLALDGDLYPLSEGYPSFYAGIFRDNRIIPLLHVGTGLEYVRNGMLFDEDHKRALHYVSIPANLKLKLGPLFMVGGIAPSFKVAERVFVNGDSSKPASDDASNWFDAPVFIGGGLKITFIMLEVRYHWGVTDVYQGYHNRYLQIGAAISF
jgi:hypothetical protein